MTKLERQQLTSMLALRRMVFRLLQKDEFSAETIDQIHSLGRTKGLDIDFINDVILECEVEMSVN